MDISNINASNAYTTNESVKPSVDSTPLKVQDSKNPEADLNQKTSSQQAFEVNITQEARDLLAAESTQPSMKNNTSSEESGQSQSPATAQEARQIVNIVA